MTRVPNPSRLGGTTAGPPFSRHTHTKAGFSPVSCRDHDTSTVPAGFDSAPYFAALVASSLTASARAKACFGSKSTSGPARTTRPRSS